MSTGWTAYILVQGQLKGLQIFTMNKSLDDYWESIWCNQIKRSVCRMWRAYCSIWNGYLEVIDADLRSWPGRARFVVWFIRQMTFNMFDFESSTLNLGWQYSYSYFSIKRSHLYKPSYLYSKFSSAKKHRQVCGKTYGNTHETEKQIHG